MSTPVRFGLAGAGLYILFYSVLYLVDLSMIPALWTNLFGLVTMTLMLIACMHRRKIQSGSLTFMEGFKTALIVAFLSMMGAFLVKTVIVQILDEAQVDALILATYSASDVFGVTEMFGKENQMEMMEESGQKEQIAEMWSPSMLFLGSMGSLLWYALVAMLIALIVKYKPSKEQSTPTSG